MIRRQLLAAVRILVVLTVITGVLYPLVITGLALGFFPEQARGSLVMDEGRAVGSALMAQGFTGADMFHPRPSAVDYDGSASGGSNLGPTNPDLIVLVASRVEEYRLVNGLDDVEAVPIDAVTSSGSGLDPHISVANARLQAGRVADARGLTLEQVNSLIDDHTEGMAFLSDPGVNVLLLNISLERVEP